MVPKTKNPIVISHHQPISLCNVLHKIVFKVLANQLQKVMNLVIDEVQSNFLPNRLIMDSVIITFEVFHSVNGSTSKAEPRWI